MEIQEIEAVKTPLIRDVLWHYREFYFLNGEERSCGCQPGNKWPFIRSEDGTPLVCEAHEWQAKRRSLQQRIIVEGLSEPIPGASDKLWGVLPGDMRKAPAECHPLRMDPYIWQPPKSIDQGSGGIASAIACWLTMAPPGKFSREHVVFFTHHSHLVTMCYQGQEQAVRDALLWAPVLVYWHNKDVRRGNGWMLDLIKLRQYGLAFVVVES